MESKVFEVTQPGMDGNWGKFLVCQLTHEAYWPSQLPGNDDTRPLMRQIGWSREFVWVLDWQTGEGVLVRPGGNARADLNKHQVWVCPMFEPFLTWLYKQDMSKLHELPQVVELDAPFDFAGYRRPGPKPNGDLIVGVKAVAELADLTTKEICAMVNKDTGVAVAALSIVEEKILFWLPDVIAWIEAGMPGYVEPVWVRIFRVLAESETGIPATELAEAAGSKSGVIAHELRLLRREAVIRVANSDSRGRKGDPYTWVLSDQGKRVWEMLKGRNINYQRLREAVYKVDL
ncbi:hypothetical protein AB0G15_05675 [Streptosporangium sp. NPDC023825]|uniref:hypothetical protein n=1 Tax=Streptosporangium sp. NPDC023825 TaxID=3154909 RepID=UPI003416252D